jgi:hemolysin activation/secretion protein
MVYSAPPPTAIADDAVVPNPVEAPAPITTKLDYLRSLTNRTQPSPKPVSAPAAIAPETALPEFSAQESLSVPVETPPEISSFSVETSSTKTSLPELSEREFSAAPVEPTPETKSPTVEDFGSRGIEVAPAQPANSSEPNSAPPAIAPAEATPTPEAIAVGNIQVTGSTILTEKELAPLTQSIAGRTATLAELQAVADQITQLYLDRGYITSRAILNRESLQSQVAQIQVLEGSLERIEIEGTRRLKPSYIRSRIELGAGKPLNANRLEDQLKLLRADPLFKNVEASLRAGSGLGQSVLIVRVTEANPFSGNVNVDNYSPPSVGSEQFGVGLSYRNLTGIGDQVLASYNRTFTGGAENIDLAYRLPVNPMDGTLQLRASWNQNRITQEPFDALDIRGNSERYEVSFRQPIVRSPREEFALSLGFAFQDGQTFTFNDLPTPFGIGPDEDGVSRTSVIKFGQEYVRRDTKGAWSLRSQFNLGTSLLDATENPGDIPDGQFFSWLGQVQRVQRLNDNNLLILQADLQLTPDGLLPSQQFVIGGGQSVRGYRQNARSGDNGFRLSVEDRITVQRNASGLPTLQIAPFAEVGAVWNVDDNPNQLPDQTFLAGVGLGVLWQPLPRLSVRLDYGLPLVNLSDRGSNIQDDGLYFSVNYQL